MLTHPFIQRLIAWWVVEWGKIEPMSRAVAQPNPTKHTRRTKTPRAEIPPEHLHELEQLIEHTRNFQLLEEDGEPLESDWHVVQIHLLDELVRQHLGEPNDYFCGGNMFVYYSVQQAEAVKTSKPAYKGPDFFVVRGVDGRKPRRCWVAWQEDGRYPDLIVELVSSSTVKKDKEENLRFYAQVLRVPESFWYDPDRRELRGFVLREGGYVAIETDERGWLWSKVLGAYWGVWRGEYQGRVAEWVRLYREDGSLVPTLGELAAMERARAEAERQRAERAEAELERLRTILQEKGIEI
jgi:Uma2 family endonuclease